MSIGTSNALRTRTNCGRKMDSGYKISCLLGEVVPGGARVEVPTFGNYRKYMSRLEMRACTRGLPQSTYCPIQFEVGAAFNLGTCAKNFKRETWLQHVMREGPMLGCSYATPVEVRKVLKEERFRQVGQAEWLTFNFDAIVCVLGAVAATLTLVPDLSTADWRNTSPSVRGLVSVEDLHAANSGGVVYYDPCALGIHAECAKWLMIYAANVCGATVVVPHLTLDVNNRPICKDYDGAELRRGLSVLLNILGTYYSMANAGDMYALALMTGVHRVLTVVGHSDEGGWLRDVLRQGWWQQPHGGVPRSLPFSSGISVDDGRTLGTFVALVDSIALGTAAAVAHCDPLVPVGDNVFPTVFTVDLPEDGELANGVMQRLMARTIADGCAKFSELYATALAKLFRLHVNVTELHAAGVLQQMASYFAESGSRHTDMAVCHPFFWIEPTTVLPAGEFGFPAEIYGYASLCHATQRRTMPFFEAIEEEGLSDTVVSHWRVRIRSPRTCGYVLYTTNHPKNGLANLLLRGFNSSALVLGTKSPEEIRCKKAAKGFVTFADLMWKRGQAKLPHPAEVLNVDGTFTVSILHAAITTRHYQKPIEHIPPPEDLSRMYLTLHATRLAYYKAGPANVEPGGVRRLRNMGVDAINDMNGVVQNTMLRMSSFPPPSETAPVLNKPGRAFGGAAAAVSERCVEPVRGDAAEESPPRVAQGQAVEATMVHASAPAPQPHRGPGPSDGGGGLGGHRDLVAGVGDATAVAAGAVTVPESGSRQTASATQQ
ncbi:coat protein [Eimeria brunetti RNA virus 1]|uniref:coat protein n=1 Tax=Eimeria brunetti RNA virus 1 TaxID=155414 RepID=UPI00000F7B5E|nr:coat protein [Eimeria brunetti RNA virus 1]AAK26437.1 coat protein [Eimeria brunetti RNA virus 1]